MNFMQSVLSKLNLCCRGFRKVRIPNVTLNTAIFTTLLELILVQF